MPENNSQGILHRLRMRYRGRRSQIWIYLGKLLRMFLYQNDWKVLPMAAMVAGLVGLVIRRRFCYSMEGTMMSALAIACVCLWNGCFNSIQVICRERDVIKREHRSGMHISSYIASHMIYQALLCILQTGIILYVFELVGVNYPKEGLFSRFFVVDFLISLFLITYAADMMSLWISSLCHTTTAAMTVMPVVLIIQLVFSGGMMSLPAKAQPVTKAVISNYGLKVIAAQADYNSQPLASAWNTVERMKSNEIRGSVTVGQILDYLSDPENPDAKDVRGLTVMEGGALKQKLTVGELVDFINADPASGELRAQTVNIDTTVGEVISALGEQDVRHYVEEQAKATAQEEDYEYTRSNVGGYWASLILFALLFAGLSTVTLEFIDHDRR